MTLGEHLEELRSCLVRALIGVAVGMIVCFFFGERLFQVMFWPLSVATGGSPPRLYFTSPPEAFSTYLRVCLIAGAILSSPYGLYQMWRFIAAGLYAHERLAVRKYLLPSIGLFLLGVVFFLVVVAPLVIAFFLYFAEHSFPGPLNVGVRFLSKYLGRPELAAASQPADAGGFVQPWLTLGSYISFVATLSLVFGLGFQTPLVVLFLGRTGIVPIAAMKRFRRYVLLVILIVSAIVTPVDVGSMIALAAPMYLLYEVGLLAAARGRPAEE